MRNNNTLPTATTKSCDQASEVSEAWRILGLDWSSSTDVDVIQSKSRSQVYRLHYVESGDGNVIAKHCRTHMAVVERNMYEQVLAKVTVRSPNFLGYVDDPNSSPDDPFSWLFFEDIGNRRFAPKNASESQRFAKWLGAMQAAMLGTQTKSNPDLPLRNEKYYRNYLERALVGLPTIAHEREFTGAIAKLFVDTHASIEVVAEHWPYVVETFNELPLTVVHGDCLPKNIHVICEPGEPVVPIDWGNAGWGLPGTDLGTSGILFGDELIVPVEVDIYAEEFRERWSRADIMTIQRGVDLGRLFWSVKVIAMSLPAFEHQSRRKTAEILRLYVGILDGAIRNLGWQYGE